MTVILIPRPLREKLGDDGADAEKKFDKHLAVVEAALIKWTLPDLRIEI